MICTGCGKQEYGVVLPAPLVQIGECRLCKMRKIVMNEKQFSDTMVNNER